MAEHDQNKVTVTKNKTKRRWTRLRVCLKAPLKLLSTVRDLYVGSITNCAGKTTSYGGGGSSLHRRSSRSPTKSFSSVSGISTNGYMDRHGNGDFRGLVRAASGRRPPHGLGEKKGDGFDLATPRKLQRSFTTGWFETIDEEKPCEFGEEVRVSTGSLCPRRRRHCVSPFPMHENRLH